ncbi:MAG: sigma-54-dependent Fis family transcriptional regulator [Gammaproteobacteria bacterium]|nr:sigma-54-dependent Fis family transcriptional regulator [Gammaproteobacteria bacterium]
MARPSRRLHVVRSWERCLNDFRLNPDGPARPVVLDETELDERCTEKWPLLAIAQCEIENLHEQLSGSGSAVMIVDTDGYVLKYLGDREFSEITRMSGLHAGANWSESVQGTNAMGTCLAERQPVLIHHTEHFFSRNVVLTCAASPIFDAQGELLGVLDVSCASSLAQQHTAVLVNMSAQTIENRLFMDKYRNFYCIRFHSRPEFINTPGEGIIAFDGAGKVIALNRCSRQQFGLKQAIQAGQYSLRDLFEATEDELLAFAERQSIYPTEIRCAQNGRRFYALAQPPSSSNPSRLVSLRQPEAKPKAKRNTIKAPLIDSLEFGDDYMRACIERAKKVINISHLPIIISGETGTGKGLLSKALHPFSDRADKPFISVNCASIPESLIESEFFGYSAGAFTGGSRGGNIGKIQAADGGTLFLDEIGDMPLHLQTALLQVLEDREVIPLGSSTPIPVNIRLISATHQDLGKLVEKRQFREDLLYRLQGLTIQLPPLRERKDRLNLACSFLNENAIKQMSFSKKAEELIQGYVWPGNIRQLRKTIQTARIFARSEVICTSEFPEEIIRNFSPELLNEALAIGDSLEQPFPCTHQAFSPLEQAEKRAIENALRDYSWSVTKAARHLNLSRTTLYRKLKKYGIESPV